MPEGEPDPRLTALGREVERAAHRVGQLETMVYQLAADLTVFTALGDDAEPDEPAGMRAWLLITDSEQARAVLEDLIGWLGRVYLRYPGAALPSCWLWHPGVVEELCWLRQAHADAYSAQDGSPAKAADWHDRHRPGVVKRIKTALGGCELALHDPPRPAAALPLAGSADRVATSWATTYSAPHPTAEELTEAEQHDHTQHRK